MMRKKRITHNRRMANDARDLGLAVIAVTHPQAAAIITVADKGQRFFRKYLR